MPLFSIIMPIYNVEKYLHESIDSVINQTIGFDKIQIILVNDGSTDGCHEICQTYKRKYPSQIIYINKENGGVSSARNAGIPYINGTYTIFFDPDDIWEKSAFEHFHKFFLNYPEAKLATARLFHFGRKGAYQTTHHLDYKYKKTALIDINKKYKYPEMLVSKTCFKTESIKHMKFDENVSLSEDILFINELILKEEKYGVVREAEYYYRKREEATSLVDNSIDDIATYTITVEHVYKKLMDMSEQEKDCILPYIQYLIINTLQWKLKRNDSKILRNTDDETKRQIIDEYKKSCKALIDRVDDTYILKQKNIPEWVKSYIFKIKYGYNAYNENNYLKYKLAKKIKCTAKILKTENDKLIIAGDAIEKYIGEDFYIYAKDQDGNIYMPTYKSYPPLTKQNLFEEYDFDGLIHVFELPLKSQKKYKFYLETHFKSNIQLKLSFGNFSRLTGLDNAFFQTEKYIIKQWKKKTIGIYKNNFKTLIATKYRFNKTLLTKVKNKELSPHILQIRKRALKEQKKKTKPIWLISDRTDLAGDNGEAFFQWLITNHKDDLDIYFVISKDSPDFQRLKEIGNVLDFASDSHIVKQLAADAIIESSGSYFTYNPIGTDIKYYRDLIDFKTIFLQHGTIIHDLSSWVHWLNTNFDMFITSATREYESIAYGNYGFKPEAIKCTGLARHDKLKNTPEKLIALAPTWRQSIALKTEYSSSRGYSELFKNSDYYNFYNNLINDERLISIMKEKGYKGTFFLHPNHRNQANDFVANDTFTVCDKSFSYSEVFNKASLLITDYSSVAMDFAYLRKPLIYTQFDKEEIYKVQVYDEGYFNFETDGFGPVTYNYETAINEIIKMIQNDCKEPETYKNRVDNFFPYCDNHNCQRIYNEIINM